MGTIADKLTYLNTTKTQLKQMISYGYPLSNETFRQYVGGVFKALINSMSDTLNPTWNNLPKITTTAGTSQSINNTIEAPMRISLSASELTQSGTPTPSSPQDIHTISGDNTIRVCGKNNINVTQVTPTGTTYNIKAPTLTNGVINVQGKNEDGYSDESYRNGFVEIKSTDELLPSTTYYVSFKATIVSNPRNVTKFLVYLGKDYNIYTNYDSEKDRYVAQITLPNNYVDASNKRYAEIRVASCELNISEVMVSTSSDTTYVPYENGTDYSVNLGYENLLNIINAPRTINGITFTPNGKNGVLINGTATANATYPLTVNSSNVSMTGVNLKANTTYTPKKFNDENDDILYQVYYSKNGSTTYSTNTFTTVESTTLGAYLRVNSGKTINNQLIELQLEESNTSHSFTPYGVTPINYSKISTYEDRIFKNIVGDTDYSSDRVDGGWYIKKNIGKSDMGEMNWVYGAGRLYSLDLTSIINKNDGANVLPNNILCNVYSKITPAVWYAKTTLGISVGGNGYGDDGSVLIYDSNYTNATTFKTDMAGNYIYYGLITPTYTQITGTLAEQLENLYNAMSKDGQTNLSQINNDLGFVLDTNVLENLGG